MTTIQFAIKPDLSKQEEIDLLNKLYTCVHSEQTYLADLISHGLVEWASQQIHDDGCTDIWDKLSSETKGNDMLLQQLNDAQTQTSKEHQALLEKTLLVQHKDGELDGARKELEENRQYNARLAVQQIRVIDAKNACLDEQQARLAHRDQTIIELKARVLNLQDKIDQLIQTAGAA